MDPNTTSDHRTTEPETVPAQGSLHTPGPWHVRDLHPGRCTFNIGTNPNDPYEGEVAVVFRAGRHVQAHHEANARLIAAAPDLLEALKRLARAYVSTMESGRDRIVALGGDCDPVDVMERGDPYLRIAKEAIAKAEGRS